MRTSNKRIKKLAASAGALGALVALSTAAPATASTSNPAAIGPASFSDCPANRICVFAATNGGAVPGWTHFPATSPGSCTNAPIPTLTGLRGALSAYNRTGRVQKLYAAANCGGDPRTVHVNTAIPNLGTPHYSIGG